MARSTAHGSPGRLLELELLMDIYLIAQNHQFHAMGCQIQLWLDCAGPELADRLFAAVENHFAESEKVLSRFQPQSELSQLNGRTGEWTVVSPLLWDVLAEALALAELTDGLYDPTLLGALEEAGYVSSFETLVQDDQVPYSEPHSLGGQWSQVRLDPQKRAVWLPPGGRLDLGGMAKGYTAEQAVAMLSGWGPCLVDAGGDVVAGLAPAGLPGWPVAIAAPGIRETADLMTLWLAEAALATSGTDYRRWYHNGRLAHHIIDPRTGRPAAADLLAASVLLQQAVQAEAVATAVLILGEQAASAWLAERHIPALLVTQTGAIHTTPALEAAYWGTTL